MGEAMSTRRRASTTPLATSSTRVMPPKMLTKMARTARIGIDDVEGGGHDVGVGPAPDVQEVGRRPPHLGDDVESGHGQPGAVGDDPDRAGEADVVETLLLGQLLPLVELFVVGVVGPFGVAVGGVVVQGHLGVEGVDPAVGGEDERVDLGQVAVALDVTGVELEQEGGRLLPGLGVEAGLLHQGGRLVEREPVDRIDVEPGDGVGVGGGHLLDLHAALGRNHAEVELGPPVQGEAGVVLAGDVRGVLDPQPVDGVAVDVHAQDGGGVAADGVGVVGQLDAPGLAPAPHLHLGLHHHRVAGGLGPGHGLVHRVGHPPGGNGDTEPGEVLLTLVLVEIHRLLPLCTDVCDSHLCPGVTLVGPPPRHDQRP